MDAPSVLDTLKAAGMTVIIDGDGLIVRPRELLNDELRNMIREHKPELVQLLKAMAEPREIPCGKCQHWTADTARPWSAIGTCGRQKGNPVRLRDLPERCWMFVEVSRTEQHA